jgi:hypothetical protein
MGYDRNGAHTLLKILLQLCIGANVGINFGMGFLGLLHELLGPLVESINGDLFFLEQLLHRIQVRPLVSHLLLCRLGPCLKQGAPLLEALLLYPRFIPLQMKHMSHLA